MRGGGADLWLWLLWIHPHSSASAFDWYWTLTLTFHCLNQVLLPSCHICSRVSAPNNEVRTKIQIKPFTNSETITEIIWHTVLLKRCLVFFKGNIYWKCKCTFCMIQILFNSTIQVFLFDMNKHKEFSPQRHASIMHHPSLLIFCLSVIGNKNQIKVLQFVLQLGRILLSIKITTSLLYQTPINK